MVRILLTSRMFPCALGLLRPHFRATFVGHVLHGGHWEPRFVLRV